MTPQLIPPYQFDVVIHPFRYCIFRLETLQNQGDSGEDAGFAAFLGGRPRRADPELNRWLDAIRNHVGAGRALQRVHVVIEPLTDYLRWKLSWGCAQSAGAGEDIRVIPLAVGQRWPDDIPQRDFWLFDASELYDMHYDLDGRWLGVEHVTDPARIVAACRWRAAALHRAVPWRRYVTLRPQLTQQLPEELLPRS